MAATAQPNSYDAVINYARALSTVDPNTIKIEVPQMELPPLDFGPSK